MSHDISILERRIAGLREMYKKLVAQKRSTAAVTKAGKQAAAQLAKLKKLQVAQG